MTPRIFSLEESGTQRMERVFQRVIWSMREAKRSSLANVGDHQRLAVFGDPSGDALADAQADGLEGLAGVSDGDGEVEFVMLLVGHEQAPGVRLEVGGDLFHDGLQNGVEVQGRRERLGYVMEDGQLWFGLADAPAWRFGHHIRPEILMLKSAFIIDRRMFIGLEG